MVISMRYILAMALLFCACTITGNVVQEETKICTILPMSGDYALFGQEFSRGMELGEVQLIIEDDSFEFRKTVIAAQQLISVRNCPGIIVPFVESAAPITNLAQQQEKPLLVMLDDSKTVDKQAFVHSVGYSIEKGAYKLVDFARNDNYTTAVVVYDQIDFSYIAAHAFKERFNERGGEIVGDFALIENDDFRSITAKIKDINPDVIYFGILLSSQSDFVKRVREQGITSKMLTLNAFQDDVIDAAGDAADGVCKSDLPPVPSEDEWLLDNYREEFGEEPVMPSFVVQGYHTAKTYQNALLQVSNEKTLDEALKQMTQKDQVESIYCIVEGETVLEKI